MNSNLSKSSYVGHWLFQTDLDGSKVAAWSPGFNMVDHQSGLSFWKILDWKKAKTSWTTLIWPGFARLFYWPLHFAQCCEIRFDLKRNKTAREAVNTNENWKRTYLIRMWISGSVLWKQVKMQTRSFYLANVLTRVLYSLDEACFHYTTYCLIKSVQ